MMIDEERKKTAAKRVEGILTSKLLTKSQSRQMEIICYISIYTCIKEQIRDKTPPFPQCCNARI